MLNMEGNTDVYRFEDAQNKVRSVLYMCVQNEPHYQLMGLEDKK